MALTERTDSLQRADLGRTTDTLRGALRRKGRLLVLFGIACAVGCGGSSPVEEESSAVDAQALHRRPHDAGTTDAGTTDAGKTDTGTAFDAGATPPPAPTSGIIACYTEGKPTATCAIPEQQCCFNNYSSQRDGFCTTAACAYGTIRCDGPEDCPGGNVCCSTRLFDPSDNVTSGYLLACRAGSTCGSDDEVCHVTSTCHQAGTQCQSAAVVDYDLPRVISLCRP